MKKTAVSIGLEPERKVTGKEPQILLPLKVVVIGDNHCWGCGDLLKEALANARNPKQYRAYIAHPDFTVSEFDGSIYSPAGYQVKLIAEKISPTPKKVIGRVP